MIYKFESKDSNGTIEISKEKNKAKFSVSNNEYEVILCFSQETLYDLIGSLHSIQTKIKNNREVNNG